ncbi:anaphase-promoting complex subunit 13-like isoform X2 [Diadema setosum]|uniref:anaphase-promoting complex subunit 13-like isoform X2 n=1 Tax=Diadema setosum TaxID=31175 RepID=UPI003B3AEF17
MKIQEDCSFDIMDSEVMREGRLLDIVDDQWRTDKLPNDDIEIPQNHMPSEAEGAKEEGEKDMEDRWTDLALHNLNTSQSSNQGN